MTRLMIHVEGETEETFVQEIIAPHLYTVGFTEVSAKLLGNARNRAKRGGIRSWPSARFDIVQRLRGNTGAYATTLVDYYALPSGGTGGWPCRDLAASVAPAACAQSIEMAIEAEVNAFFSNTSMPDRFVGGILLHEFEALLFADCRAFAEGVGNPNLAGPMQEIRNQFASPEDINDSPITAPSKRMEGLISGYQKPIYGTIGALHIGLDRLRAECPHFNRWLTRLEALI